MSIDETRVMIAALAEPEVLLVFSAIVMATSTARPGDDSGRPGSGTSYITPFGLVRQTSLTRDVVERAAGCLVRAGLVKASADPFREFDSWRVDESALAAAAASS